MSLRVPSHESGRACQISYDFILQFLENYMHIGPILHLRECNVTMNLYNY